MSSPVIKYNSEYKQMTRKDAKKLEDSDTNKYLINFYLSADAVEKIDDVLFYLKKKLPIDKRRKLTKSIFYEVGLKIVAEDYNKRGEESLLWKAIHEFMNK